MDMNWLLYNLIANLSVITLEGIYRKGLFTSLWALWSAYPITILLVIATQWGLFYTFKLAPNYFLAGAVFSLINLVLRIGMNAILGEPFHVKTAVGLSLLLVSCILLK